MPSFTHLLLRVALVALMTLLMSPAATAADPDIFATKTGALRGVDVVAYHSLDPAAKAVITRTGQPCSPPVRSATIAESR